MNQKDLRQILSNIRLGIPLIGANLDKIRAAWGRLSRWHTFGILKRLHGGVRVKIALTYYCTLSCNYCLNRVLDGERPSCDWIRFTSWKKILTGHRQKIREVVLSGGEPMLHPDFVKLVDWLVSRGIYVTVFTNLTLLSGLKAKPSHRIRLDATYHRSFPRDKFLANLARYRERFRVDVEEIETRMIPGSVTKSTRPCAEHHLYFTEHPCGAAEMCTQQVGFYTPDGQCHDTILDAIRHVKGM